MPGLLSRYQWPFAPMQWGMQPQPQPPILGPMGPAPADTMQMPWGNGQPFANLYNQPQTPKQPVPKQPQPGDQASQPAFSPQQLPVDGIGLQSDGQNLGPQGPGYRKPNFIETVGQGVQDFGPLNLARLGMSMMGNAANPNGWAQVGQDLGGILQEKTQQKQLERQNKREDTGDTREAAQFKAWQEDQAAQAASEKAFNDYVTGLPDGEEKKTLASIGWKGFPQYQLQKMQQAAEAERLKANEAFESGQTDKQIAAENARQANAIGVDKERIRSQEDIASGKIAGRKDQMGYKLTLDKLNKGYDAADAAQQAMSSMDRYAELIKELGDASGMQNPFDVKLQDLYANVVKGNNATKAKAIREEMSRLQGRMVSEFVQAIKPVSNADFKWAQSITPNSNWTVQGALNAIAAEKSKLGYDLNKYQKSVDWNENVGDLVTGKNDKGQTFLEAMGARPYADWQAYAPSGGATGAAAQAPAATQSGRNYTDPETGEQYVYVGPANGDRNDPKNWQMTQAGGYRGR